MDYEHSTRDARPRYTPGMAAGQKRAKVTREIVLPVRMNDDENRDFETLAARAGLPTSTWLRMLGNREREKAGMLGAPAPWFAAPAKAGG